MKIEYFSLLNYKLLNRNSNATRVKCILHSFWPRSERTTRRSNPSTTIWILKWTVGFRYFECSTNTYAITIKKLFENVLRRESQSVSHRSFENFILWVKYLRAARIWSLPNCEPAPVVNSSNLIYPRTIAAVDFANLKDIRVRGQ